MYAVYQWWVSTKVSCVLPKEKMNYVTVRCLLKQRRRREQIIELVTVR